MHVKVPKESVIFSFFLCQGIHDAFFVCNACEDWSTVLICFMPCKGPLSFEKPVERSFYIIVKHAGDSIMLLFEKHVRGTL